jgi:hypothetical protein
MFAFRSPGASLLWRQANCTGQQTQDMSLPNIPSAQPHGFVPAQPAHAPMLLAGRSLREGGSSASESSCTSSESESEASTSESATTESSDQESAFEDSGDAAIELAAAGVQSGAASEVMPDSGCAKRAGITGNLDAQSKPASEATSSGQYPGLRHMSSVLLRRCIWEFQDITVMQVPNQRTCTSRRASSKSLLTMLSSLDWA